MASAYFYSHKCYKAEVDDFAISFLISVHDSPILVKFYIVTRFALRLRSTATAFSPRGLHGTRQSPSRASLHGFARGPRRSGNRPASPNGPDTGRDRAGQAR